MAGRNYFLLGSMSGTEPGILLPGGQATLPLNWDFFTDLTLEFANTAFFLNFNNVLDGSGRAAATLDTLGPLPAGSAGASLYFAFLLYDPYDYASNPVEIEIVR
jgi:hypothetical protein